MTLPKRADYSVSGVSGTNSGVEGCGTDCSAAPSSFTFCSSSMEVFLIKDYIMVRPNVYNFNLSGKSSTGASLGFFLLSK